MMDWYTLLIHADEEVGLCGVLNFSISYFHWEKNRTDNANIRRS